MLEKSAERILRRMDRMGFAGAGEALREIERQQAQIALLKAVVRELTPYPEDKLPPHIQKALGDHGSLPYCASCGKQKERCDGC